MPTVKIIKIFKRVVKPKKSKGAAVRIWQLLKHTVLLKSKASVSVCYDTCCQESVFFIIKSIICYIKSKALCVKVKFKGLVLVSALIITKHWNDSFGTAHPYVRILNSWWQSNRRQTANRMEKYHSQSGNFSSLKTDLKKCLNSNTSFTLLS